MSWSVRAEILERELAFPIVKWPAAAQTKQWLIMGRWRLNAYDLVGRIAVRASEAGLGWHQGSDFSTDSGILYPSDKLGVAD